MLLEGFAQIFSDYFPELFSYCYQNLPKNKGTSIPNFSLSFLPYKNQSEKSPLLQLNANFLPRNGKEKLSRKSN